MHDVDARRLVRWYSPLPTLALRGGMVAAVRDARRGPRYVPALCLALLPVALRGAPALVPYVAYGVGLVRIVTSWQNAWVSRR